MVKIISAGNEENKIIQDLKTQTRISSGIKTYLWSFPLQIYRWPRLGEEAAEIWRETPVFI